MKDLGINDYTQSEIKKHLKETEELIKLASGAEEVEITVMPDCCPAHNVTRMLGGFFTGTVTKIHNPKRAFIPVDATVNVCGVCIWKLKDYITPEEFPKRVILAMAASPEPYTWNNFNRGNHFVSLMESSGTDGLEKGQYLVVHASANEFKKALYPHENVWYKDEIKTVTHPDNPKRYIRYIEGETAEKFYAIAKNLLPFNQKRNTEFCKFVLGELAEKEILNVQHYGMPNPETICIGVQWETDGIVPLLTAPGKDIYLVKPKSEYFPHGFGLEIAEGDIHYTEDGGICVGTKILYTGDNLTIGVDAINRAHTSVEDCVSRILEKTPAKVCVKLSQIASINASGFLVWNA